MSTPFSNLDSGSDFISQWVYTGLPLPAEVLDVCFDLDPCEFVFRFLLADFRSDSENTEGKQGLGLGVSGRALYY